MAHLTRSATLHSALADWRARGLIDAATAETLAADIGPPPRARGFGGFVILAGMICLIFGAITFVAANWEAMSRLARLTLILALLWAAWGGTAWARLRGLGWLSGTLTLLACGIFGAGIMLVSQMYHIQGDARDAVWLWMLGTLAGAGLARSPMALALAFGLLALWHGWGLTDGLIPVNWLFLAPWSVAAALCLWMRSRAGAHLAALTGCGWALSEIVVYDLPTVLFMLTSAGGFALVALLLASHGGPRHLRGFEPEALAYVLCTTGLMLLPLWATPSEALPVPPALAPVAWGALAGAAVLAVALALMAGRRGWQTGYDLWVTVAFVGIVSLVFFVLLEVPALPDLVLLALSIWCVRLGHRLEAPLLRVFGGLWFAGIMLAIYAKTVGGLLGTSLFYLGAGALLLAGALVAARLARRREARP